MTYSCSSHFPDQFSYIKHFISNYGLQDMIYARFAKRDRINKGMGWYGPDLSGGWWPAARWATKDLLRKRAEAQSGSASHNKKVGLIRCTCELIPGSDG
jgi:hypothetical protein